MGPVLIIVGVGVLALAAAVALVTFIAKGSDSRRRTTWLCVALVFVSLIGFVVLNIASTNYIIPLGWIIGLAIAPIAAVGLIVLIGIDVKWKASRLIASVGLILVSGIIFAALAMSQVGSAWVQPLFVNRAAQIAEANGFTALLPADEDMITDYLPVDALPEPDEGFGAAYEDFTLQERKGTDASEDDLMKLVSAGARPLGQESMPIPSGGTITTTTVQGQPAVATEYEVTEGKMGTDEGKAFTNVILVFELQGVDVRMATESGVRESGGEWVPFSNLSVQDLVAIAETMEPVE